MLTHQAQVMTPEGLRTLEVHDPDPKKATLIVRDVAGTALRAESLPHEEIQELFNSHEVDLPDKALVLPPAK